MKLFTSIMESLELDKSLDRQLVENEDRYGKRPVSGNHKNSKSIDEDTKKSTSVETGTNEGGHGVFNPGETPESGTAKTAKFKKEEVKKSADCTVEEVKKDEGNGEQVYGEEPKQSIPATGLKEAEESGEQPVEEPAAEEVVEDEPEFEEPTEEPAEEPEQIEEPVEEPVEGAGSCEPKSIEIELDKDGTGINEVEITFTCQPNEEDVKTAIEKFCGEEFFTVLEPVSEETEDGEFKYTYQFKEFNRDEDLVKQAEALEDESEVEGE